MRDRQAEHLARHPKCVDGSKLRYKTMTKAEKALAQIILHGSGRQVPCRAYECARCGGWHLTSRPREVRVPGARP